MSPKRDRQQRTVHRKQGAKKMLDVHPRQDFIFALVRGERNPPFAHVAAFQSLKGWSGSGRLNNEGGSSPNQCKLSRTCALTAAALGDGARVDDAIAINVAFYQDMQRVGHWCFPRGGDSGGAAVEFGGGSHTHIWLNAESVDWLCCLKIGERADELRQLVERDLRIQSALMRECRYIDSADGKLRYIIPGARNEKQGDQGRPVPEYHDDERDRWGRWVMEGDRKIPKNVDAYWTALYALRESEKIGGETGALVGGDRELRLPDVTRFGFHAVRDGRDFAAWVETLGNPASDVILNPAHLVGTKDGVPFFEFTREGADDRIRELSS